MDLAPRPESALILGAVPIAFDPFARFIAQVISILLVARVLGLLARRFGQPMVVAEIVAGILLGPSLLGWLWPDLSSALFAPESMPLLQVVSQLGLVLFMFLIGLEFDRNLLRGRGRSSLVISQSTFFVPFGFGVLLAFYLPEETKADVSPAALALFLGATSSVTAFPVLARILSERRLLRSRVGAITIACAAIDDVLAWCLLGFALAWVRAKGLLDAAVTTVLTMAYVVVMLLLVRPILRRLAQRMPEGGPLSQDLVAVVMLLLFFSSWATELIGVHALFGAFLLGAILPRAGGFAHALVDKLEDLVVVVLLPLFFAYSGVRTEIGLLDTAEAWLTCGIVVVVATLSKFGSGTLAARLTGMRWRESAALGALMNTRGLMVLIVLNVGLDVGVISPTLFTMLVLMALFTTLFTTPVLDAVYPPEQHVEDLLAASRAGAEPRRPRAQEAFTMLLYLSDGRAAQGLLELAAALDGASTETRLHALHLLRPRGQQAGLEKRESDLDDPLERWLKRAEDRRLAIKPTSFVSADPAEDILRMTEVKGADLVLLERPWPKTVGPILDRTVERITHESRADTAVLFDGGLAHVRKASLLLSGTASDDAATSFAARLLDSGVELTVVHARGARTAHDTVRALQVEHGSDNLVATVIERATNLELLRACGSGCDLAIMGVAPNETLTRQQLKAYGDHAARGGSLVVVCAGQLDMAATA